MESPRQEADRGAAEERRWIDGDFIPVTTWLEGPSVSACRQCP